MEEIQIGEFVRTKNGNIAKLMEKLPTDEYEEHKTIRYSFLKRIIVKHSKNILDLIEKNDYVNGHKVINIDISNDIIYTDTIGYDGSIKKYNIQTILTKEMFENNCYRIRE